MNIHKKSNSGVNVSIYEKSNQNITFNINQIRSNTFIDKEYNAKSYSLNLDNSKYRFFMKIDIIYGSVFYDIAFTYENIQYCFNGISTNNATIKENYEKEISPLFDDVVVYHSSVYRRSLENSQDLERSVLRTGTINYGLAFEAPTADFSSVVLPEELPNDYWESDTEIDIGIYRRTPSESQIKSDLRTYNEDQYTPGEGYYYQNIKALAPYAHGTNIILI